METFDRRGLLRLMGRRTSVLLVGNHIEPSGVVPDESECVFVMNGNSNKIPEALVDCLATFTDQPPESKWSDALCYPKALRLVSEPATARYLDGRRGGVGVALMRSHSVSRAQRAQGLTIFDSHATPTIGFTMLVMLEDMQVPVRVAGFSWYRGPNDVFGSCHRPDKEREYVKRTLNKNSFFTFTDETLKWLE
jgi:hypothetical protein